MCFIRNIFPSDVFEKITFGSTDVRVIRKKDSGLVNEEALQLRQMEEAAYEAMAKGYLK